MFQTSNTLPVIIIPCLDELTHVAANNFQCDDPTCPCHTDDTDEVAERLYVEQGMAASRDSLPWYGMLAIEAVEHAPWCNCPRCRPGEPDDEGDEQEGSDEHPFL